MKKTYNPDIDVLRIISSLAVVFIHTTTKTLDAASYDLERLPWTLFLNQTLRFAVPLFFLISGFVLELNYPYHATYLTYLKKRLNRVLIPYVVWSLIYYFFVYPNHDAPLWSDLLTGDASYQLYFIPTLLIFYLIFPVIHRYYRFLTKLWIFIPLGIIQIILLYMEYYIHSLPFIAPIRIALLNYFIFFLGIVASHHQQRIMTVMKKWKYLVFFITVLLSFYVFFEGRNLYLKTSNYLSFYSQWRPSILFYTLFLTASLYFIFSKFQIFPALIKQLSKLSFFVFFVHIIFLEIVWNTVGNTLFTKTNTRIAENIWYDPFFFLIIASLSFLTAFIIHKSSFLTKLTG